MRIDLSSIYTEKQLHEILASSFNFPEYYGNNWDAFWDCICDLTELPKTIEFSGSNHLEATLPKCFEQLKKCFCELRSEFPNFDSIVNWD